MAALLAALLLALGASTAGAADPSAEDAAAYRWARGFMTGGAALPQETREGDHRTRFGTIVDPTCRQPVDPSQGARALELARVLHSRSLETLDRDLAGTLRVTRACADAYPELAGLLSDVVAVLWRSIIYCRPRAEFTLAGMSTFTIAYTSPIHTEQTPDSHGRSVGEHARTRRLYYIVLPDSLPDFQDDWAAPQRMETLFHEALHYSGANNRFDHNQVEAVAVDKVTPCGLNQLDDRIVFLTTLCGFPSQSSRAVIEARIEACAAVGIEPLERGCMHTLMGIYNGTEVYDPASDTRPLVTRQPHFYGRPLARTEARRLCRRIREGGARRRQVRAAEEAASLRAARALKVWVAREAHALLDEPPPTPAARYLAPLSAADRQVIASDPAFTRLAALCAAEADGSIDPVRQRYECPLRRGHPLESSARRLVEFNDSEARLNRETRRLVEGLWGLKTAATLIRGEDALDAAAEEVAELYGRHCLEAPGPGDFVPRLCQDGRTILGETIEALRRAEHLRDED